MLNWTYQSFCLFDMFSALPRSTRWIALAYVIVFEHLAYSASFWRRLLRNRCTGTEVMAVFRKSSKMCSLQNCSSQSRRFDLFQKFKFGFNQTVVHLILITHLYIWPIRWRKSCFAIHSSLSFIIYGVVVGLVFPMGLFLISGKLAYTWLLWCNQIWNITANPAIGCI